MWRRRGRGVEDGSGDSDDVGLDERLDAGLDVVGRVPPVGPGELERQAVVEGRCGESRRVFEEERGEPGEFGEERRRGRV